MSPSTDPAAEGEFDALLPRQPSFLDRYGIPHLDRLFYLAALARELVVRDLKLRYKRTILGVAWSLVSPLAQWLVLGFVFRFILQIQIERYLSFLFTGIVVWSWFQSSLSACATCVIDNAPLLRRPGFPAPILPLIAVTTQFVQFLFSLPVLLVGATLDGDPFSLALLALPPVMFLQFVLTLGIGYFLSTLHVNYRDTKHLLDIVLMLAFYLTPVFYDGRAVPAPYDHLFRLNPMLHLLEAYRAIIVSGRRPAFMSLAVVAAFAAVLFAIGHQRYRKQSPIFAEEL